MPERVQRFDFSRLISKPVKTQQGFLKVPGNLVRIGVLEYRRVDGSIVKELHEPTEVFKQDSLDSLKGAPITDQHTSMITPSNVGGLSCGFVGEQVEHDQQYVKGTLTFQRQDMIEKVELGERVELSPGYVCKLDPTPGSFNGERYDAIQRDIVYNHVAIGPKDWGRAGSGVALRMDGLEPNAAFEQVENFDGLQFGSYVRDRLDKCWPRKTKADLAESVKMSVLDFDNMLDGKLTPEPFNMERIADAAQTTAAILADMIPNYDAGNPKRMKARAIWRDKETRKDCKIMKTQITLDGVSYEVELPDALAANFSAGFAKLETELKDATKKTNKLEGELTAANKSAADFKVKLDAAIDPGAVDKAVNERVKLVETAKKIAPEIKTDGKDAKAIKVEALIVAGYEQETLDGKNDGFIDGLFEATVKNAPAADSDGSGSDGGTRSAGVSSKPVEKREDGDIDPFDSEAAHKRMMDTSQKQWQNKLDATG